MQILFISLCNMSEGPEYRVGLVGPPGAGKTALKLKLLSSNQEEEGELGWAGLGWAGLGWAGLGGDNETSVITVGETVRPRQPSTSTSGQLSPICRVPSWARTRPRGQGALRRAP